MVPMPTPARATMLRTGTSTPHATPTAEIDHAWLFEHLRPIAGEVTGPVFEGWTVLSAPAVLAKIATTVDIVSGGRREFGIGAGSRPSHPIAVASLAEAATTDWSVRSAIPSRRSDRTPYPHNVARWVADELVRSATAKS